MSSNNLQTQLEEQRMAILELSDRLDKALQPPSSAPPRGRQTARNRETTRLKTVLSGLGNRITNPFIFTVALDQVQRAAANQPQSPLS